MICGGEGTPWRGTGPIRSLKHRVFCCLAHALLTAVLLATWAPSHRLGFFDNLEVRYDEAAFSVQNRGIRW